MNKTADGYLRWSIASVRIGVFFQALCLQCACSTISYAVPKHVFPAAAKEADVSLYIKKYAILNPESRAKSPWLHVGFVRRQGKYVTLDIVVASHSHSMHCIQLLNDQVRNLLLNDEGFEYIAAQTVGGSDVKLRSVGFPIVKAPGFSVNDWPSTSERQGGVSISIVRMCAILDDITDNVNEALMLSFRSELNDLITQTMNLHEAICE